MAKAKKPGRAGAVGALVGVAAVGLGAGLAAERWLVGRSRLRPDPYSEERYGKLKADRSYRVVSFDGAVLKVDEMGPPEAKSGAVFLHGFALDSSIWHHQMLGLRGDFRYVYYDARHHGRSRGGKDSADTKVLAKDLQVVLDRSGLERVVLVGHSMGGMTTLEFCRERPEEVGTRVLGLVLVNTTFTDAIKTVAAAEVLGPLERHFGGVVRRVFDSPRRAEVARLRSDDLSYWLVRLFGFGPDASVTQIEYVRKVLACFPSPELLETIQGLRRFDMEEALDAIDVPTLIIAGADDRITTVRASHKMADSIPGARLVVLDRTGHVSMLEREGEFNEWVEKFLVEVLEEAAG